MIEYRFEPNFPFQAELDGVAYKAIYKPPLKKGKQELPSELRISVTVPTDGEFHLAPETLWDRLGKILGIAQEIHTEDPEFDARCYVRSDTPAFAAAYLGDPVKRLAFLDLQRLGFPEVRLQNGELVAIWTRFDPARHGTPELVEEAAARLVILSRNLPPPSPELMHNVGGRRIYVQWLLWPLLLLSIPATIIGFIFEPVDGGQWALRTLPLWGIGLLGFAVAAAILIRGTSRSHYAWFQLMLGAVLLLPWGSCGMVSMVNAVTDTSPEQEHEVEIVRKYTSHSKRGTSYMVVCRSWHDPQSTRAFSISGAEYAQVVEGRSRMRIVTRAGGLGMEWIVRWQLILRPLDEQRE